MHWGVEGSIQSVNELVREGVFGRNGAKRRWKLYYAISEKGKKDATEKVDSQLDGMNFEVCSTILPPKGPFLASFLRSHIESERAESRRLLTAAEEENQSVLLQKLADDLKGQMS
mmetsp:Transcript_17469/g.34264  ORF Transcript_17469/g.34264 Transcript_17469/m.34264 type:complete len:115 (+) Transcript_17469:3781-4125(+)